MKKKLIRPTDKEDRLITVAASNDYDNVPLTDDEWNRVKVNVKRDHSYPLDSEDRPSK